MSNDDDIDWDAFAILSADPEIDAATAYVANIRDEPSGPEQHGDNVHLEVRDWGRGFQPPNGAKGGVHGLRGMMERARIVGGTCRIESAPGEGTRIIAELPFRTRA